MIRAPANHFHFLRNRREKIDSINPIPPTAKQPKVVRIIRRENNCSTLKLYHIFSSQLRLNSLVVRTTELFLHSLSTYVYSTFCHPDRVRRRVEGSIESSTDLQR